MIGRLDAWLRRAVQAIFRLLKRPLEESQLQSALQLVKFCLVGVMNTAVSYMTYVLFVALGMHYIVSSAIAFVVSTANAYFWNHRYVFASEEKWWLGLIKTYCSYAVTGVVLYNILLWLLVDVCHISKFLSPLIVLLVTIPTNFLLNKYWTFRAKKGRDTAAEE